MRRLLPPVVAILLVAAAAVATAHGRTSGAPRSIAALGASTSIGFSAASSPGPQPANSWVTGTNPKVHSIFVRLRQRNGAGERAFNAAEPGVGMALLATQAERIPKHADLVTIDMGTNDACESPTAVAEFRRNLVNGLKTIAERVPNARIVVLSIRNELAKWDAVKSLAEARSVRSLCMAALTTSGRRALAKAIRAMNHEIAIACGRQPRCRYDGGAAFRIRWSRADVSSVDYFHPSVAGQRKTADAVWASGAITAD